MRTSRLLVCLLFLPAMVFSELVVDDIDFEPVSGEEPVVDAPPAKGHNVSQVKKEDVLSFFNGNQLNGSLMSMTPEQIRWKHSDVPEPITFGSKNLKQIVLVTEDDKMDDLLKLPRVEFTNGDALRGKLLELKGDTLVVSSPAYGTMNIKRSMLQNIFHQSGTDLLYRGPNKDEWTFKNHSGTDKNWKLVEGALIAPVQNLSAAFEPRDLPDRITLSLFLEWKGNLSCNLGFWGSDSENPNYNTFTMSLQNRYVRIHRNFQKHGHANIASQQLQPYLNEGKVSLKLHLDKTQKHMTLFLDDAMIGQWRDMADFPLRGDYLMFYNQTNSPIRISNIQIREWTGELDSGNTPRPETKDEIRTVSGDTLTGTVQRLDQETLFFASEFADLKIPLERLQSIAFAESSQEVPKEDAAVVHLHSVTGDRFTLDLGELKEGVIAGSSLLAGDVRFEMPFV